MECGVFGDLGLVIRILENRAEPGSVIILLLVIMVFLVLVLAQKTQLAKVHFKHN
jgi:hypothetical protein